MWPELRELIEAFSRTVAWAMQQLREGGVPAPPSNVGWWATRIPQHGALPSGITYRKHGYGVEVRSDARVVDFDFGERGETDGFDAWRLWQFAEANGVRIPFATNEEMTAALDDAEIAGFVTKRGALYYLTVSSRSN